MRISRICGTVVVAFAFASVCAAQTYDLSWYTIDGGGGTSTGGVYELSGTIGQPDANSVAMTGGVFELRGGFWPGATADPCGGQLLADSNCDNLVNNFDIDAFVLALTSPSGYAAAYPTCNYLCANDVDGDGIVTNFDIDVFVGCIVNGGCP